MSQSNDLAHLVASRHWWHSRDITTVCGLTIRQSMAAPLFCRKCPVCTRLYAEAKQAKKAKT